LRISNGSPATPNTAPTSPSPNAAGTVTPGPVRLIWAGGTDTQTPAALLRYNVRIGTAPGAGNVKSGAIQQGATTAGATTSLIINLATGTYYWAAQTVDSGQMKSSWSAESSFNVRWTDNDPPVFAGLQSASDTTFGGSVDLQWAAATDNTPPITYDVYYKSSTGSYNFTSPATSVTALNVRVSGLVNGAQYSFIVRARDSLGHEDTNSVERTATPTMTGAIAPNPATNLAGSLIGTTITLTWTPPTHNNDGSPLADLSGYNIYRGAACQDAGATKLNTTLVATSTYQDIGVPVNSILYYFVKAVNSAQRQGAASECKAVSTYAKGVQGTVKKYDTSGGTVAGTGYPVVGAQGLTMKLLEGPVEVGVATTDTNGYFMIPVTGDTAGKTYTVRMNVTAASGFLGDDGSFSGGTGYRTVADGMAIGNAIVTVTVRQVGVGPAVGDANCDWQVDLTDFLAMKRIFGVSKGETGYDVNDDFNGDETIDLTDFLLLKPNFSLLGNPVAPSPCTH